MGFSIDSTVIVSGIGIVSRTVTGVSFPGPNAYRYSSVLLSYRLQE
jgi:hypothetical protein